MRSSISQGAPLFGALALAATLCLACASKSPQEKLLDATKPAASWIATLRMTGERWNANSVPASFVKATAGKAVDELGAVAEEAGKSPVPPEVRLPLQRLMTAARAAGSGLERAVEAGDRPAAARQVARLAALEGELAAWRSGQKGRAP
ncbi:MAG TPA: hypothetical protein VLB76_28525 [Thermoanaerobaculia bacterium]|nr:hypothetical protein [Thermoanaerobaculia bacterium]